MCMIIILIQMPIKMIPPKIALIFGVKNFEIMLPILKATMETIAVTMPIIRTEERILVWSNERVKPTANTSKLVATATMDSFFQFI